MKRFFVIAILVCVAASALPSSTEAATLSKPQNKLGLVGYWSFNEGAGTTAHDFSGNGNNGTLSGTTPPSWTTGKKFDGLSFDGSTSYVDVPDSSSFTFGTNPISISAWVNFNSGGLGVYQAIVSQGLGSFELNKSSGNKLRLEMKYSSDAVEHRVEESTASLTTANKWYFVAAVFDPSTGAAQLYVNGAAKTISYVDAQVGGTINDFSSSVQIGRRNSGQLQLNGMLDDLRIYSRALSATEVAALYTAGSVQLGASNTQVKSGLVGWWTFDGSDISGTTATDKSGNGNNGTLMSSPLKTIGKLGQALSFDGSATYVNINSSSSLNLGNTFSLCAWVYLNTTTNAASIVSKQYTGSGKVPYALGLGLNGGDTTNLQFGFYNAAWSLVNETGVFPTKVWKHVCGTWDGTTASLYIDGALNNAATPSGTSADNANAIYIGRRHDSFYGSPYFDGKIDDVRIYNRALSASEVKQIYGEGGAKIGNSAKTLTQGSTLLDGLLAHWTFDGTDTGTSTASDISGNGITGTFVGGVTKTIGKLGQALSFDGTSAYVTMGDYATPFDSQTQFSTSAWVKVNTLGTAVSNHNVGNVMLARASVSYNDNYELGFNSTGHVMLYIDTTGRDTGADTSTGTITAGTWHLITVTYDTSSGAKIYIDGALDTTISAFNTALDTAAGSPTTIGYTDHSKVYLDGEMDDVRIYNRALSASEVKQLYNLGN